MDLYVWLTHKLKNTIFNKTDQSTSVYLDLTCADKAGEQGLIQDKADILHNGYTVAEARGRSTALLRVTRHRRRGP